MIERRLSRWLVRWLAVACATAWAGVAVAQAPAGASRASADAARPTPAGGLRLDWSAVLDGSYTTEALALGSRDRGFGLGHTELGVGATVDDWFIGRLTAALHQHDGHTDLELEEAYIETVRLPRGATLRAGRFLSQVGYLNEQHTHADDFVERPLLYRAFLGSHYFDTGLRANWVAPTPFYWRTGVEVFHGGQLVQEARHSPRVGVWTASTRFGGDLGLSHSWQLGLAWLGNRREPVADDDHGHEHGDGHDHDHAHGAQYSGRRMVIADAVWKWAPDGNNHARQLRLSAEYARVTRLNEYAAAGDLHTAWYLSAVWRFAPQWEVGARLDELKVRQPHGDHFHSARLQEASVALAWKRTHFSTLRLQWTQQRNRGGFAEAERSLQLQYVMNLGAHGAHSF